MATKNSLEEIKKGNKASVVPDWLSEKLFEQILQENVPNYKRTLNFKAFPALSVGENYATVMLRVEIEVELQDAKTKTVPYMLKVVHENEMMKEMIRKNDIFKIENVMYQDVVPEFEQMYRDAGVNIKFGAKCYKLPTTEYAVLLEDLRQRGFKNANRLEGLNMEHSECVLRKLAQWHAASATRIANKGKYPAEYTTGFFKEDQREFIKLMTANLNKYFFECLPGYAGNEVYAHAMQKLAPKVVDELFKLIKIDGNAFNVLNHGDCWANNIMFQYDAFGTIKETYFVDYQVPRYGPPTQDLYYFLLSSTAFDLKLKQFDYFIKYYHDNLIEHLKLLQYPKTMPSLKDIHIALHKSSVYCYSVVTGVMSVVLLDPTNDANIDNIVNESEDADNFKRLMFSNARYRKHIEAILPWLYNRGVFDC